MISTIRYRSFKDLDLRRRRPAWILPAIALFFAIVAFQPELALAALALVFVLSGPIGKLVGLFRRRETTSAAGLGVFVGVGRRRRSPVGCDLRSCRGDQAQAIRATVPGQGAAHEDAGRRDRLAGAQAASRTAARASRGRE